MVISTGWRRPQHCLLQRRDFKTLSLYVDSEDMPLLVSLGGQLPSWWSHDRQYCWEFRSVVVEKKSEAAPLQT